MCGRYTLITEAEEFAEEFGILRTNLDVYLPSYNVAPTQRMPIVRMDDGELLAESYRWGLIPSWSKDEKIGSRMINARGETVHEKPSFRAAFKRRRCLVPASGFYEWTTSDDGKQPHYIYRPDRKPIYFAGLYEHWDKGDVPIDSYAIITTEANDWMQRLHHRMPVVIHTDDAHGWLDSETDSDAVRQLLEPVPNDYFTSHAVGRAVGNPRNNAPSCIEPIAR